MIFLLVRRLLFRTSTYVLFKWSVQTVTKKPLMSGSNFWSPFEYEKNSRSKVLQSI